MKLIYRMNTKDDEEALVKLWCEHGGWDQIDAEIWRERFMGSPCGPASIVVAVDQESGEIVGQFAFIPAPISVCGCELKGYRPFAPIMAKVARGLLGKGHPIVTMYFYGIDYLKAQGNSLIYMLPDPRWMRLFRIFPFLQCGSFPLWSLPLPLKEPIPLEGYTVSFLESWDAKIDTLWQKTSPLYSCSIVRDNRVLAWKLDDKKYKILTIRRGAELVGLVASKKWGDRQWLICDLLVTDQEDTLQATLIAVTNLAYAHSKAADPQEPIHKVAILAIPLMEPVLKKIGYQRDEYDFPIIIHLLDSSIKKDDISPTKWYVSAND
jgi:hypothetical protein